MVSSSFFSGSLVLDFDCLEVVQKRCSTRHVPVDFLDMKDLPSFRNGCVIFFLNVLGGIFGFPVMVLPIFRYRVLLRIGTFSLVCVGTKVPIATHLPFCESQVRSTCVFFFFLKKNLIVCGRKDLPYRTMGKHSNSRNIMAKFHGCFFALLLVLELLTPSETLS